MTYTQELEARRAKSATAVDATTPASAVRKTKRESTYGQGVSWEFSLRTRIGVYTYIAQRDVDGREWELRRVEFDNPFRNRLVINEMSTLESCVAAAIRNATW